MIELGAIAAALTSVGLLASLISPIIKLHSRIDLLTYRMQQVETQMLNIISEIDARRS